MPVSGSPCTAPPSGEGNGVDGLALVGSTGSTEARSCFLCARTRLRARGNEAGGEGEPDRRLCVRPAFRHTRTAFPAHSRAPTRAHGTSESVGLGSGEQCVCASGPGATRRQAHRVDPPPHGPRAAGSIESSAGSPRRPVGQPPASPTTSTTRSPSRSRADPGRSLPPRLVPALHKCTQHLPATVPRNPQARAGIQAPCRLVQRQRRRLREQPRQRLTRHTVVPIRRLSRHEHLDSFDRIDQPLAVLTTDV